MTSRTDKADEPRLTVLIGPSGSGKTTLRRYNPELMSGTFHDVDALTEQFEGDGHPNEEAYRLARSHIDREQRRQTSDGESFSFDTVLSHDTIEERIESIEAARRHGFITRGVVLCSKNSQINIDRVGKRVDDETGHHVDEESVQEQWKSLPRNTVKVLPALKEVVILDISANPPVMIGIVEGELFEQRISDAELEENSQAWSIMNYIKRNYIPVTEDTLLPELPRDVRGPGSPADT